MKKGSFVKVKNRNWGIGKLISWSGHNSRAKVGFFVSLAKPPIEKIVSLENIEPVDLSLNTRAYVKDSGGKWFIGRIQALKGDKYKIDLPDRMFSWIPSTYIHFHVRCIMPIDDPMEILTIKGYETAAYHTFRSEFLKCLIRQRGGSRGMPGLLSSRIHLYPHQVEVARRVLEDPVQRYLLADEVGLGKTIEAGIVLRQYLLDYPRGEALLIVPSHLIGQWKEELEGKHLTCGNQERVHIVSLKQLEDISEEKQYDFLVVDEAQHVAAKAFSPDALQKSEFEKISQLANDAGRLLLLSATPVLNNERDFLGMLHLLDPTNYRLEDLDQFRTKVSKRQDLGRLLLSFKEGKHKVAIKIGLKKLKTLFPGDDLLSEMLLKLEEIINWEDYDQDLCNKTIREIRIHLSETYRLHRRMLRNRRESVARHLNIARFEEDRSSLNIHYKEDPLCKDLQELLEEWRDSAKSFLLSLEEEDRVARKQDLINVFRTLWEGTGTWPGTLQMMVQVRQHQCKEDAKRRLGEKDYVLLRDTPYFPGEQEILDHMAKALSFSPGGSVRLDLVMELVKKYIATKNIRKKCVVFTSHTPSALKLERVLSKYFSENAVAFHLAISKPELQQKNLDKFYHQNRCHIMVCDASAEEGLNLQYAEMIIHFDFPCSPNAIEQRIGRVDRIGRKKPLITNIIVGAGEDYCLHKAWFQLLHRGFKIFQESIASLQFYVDEKLEDIIWTTFLQGAPGLHSLISIVAQGIEEEQIKISEQLVLDEIDIMDARTQSFLDKLKEMEDNWSEILDSCHKWITYALMFKNMEGQAIDPVKYKSSSRTLIPADRLQDMEESLIAKGTYNRNTAVANPSYAFYRIGEPFIDQLYAYLLWDDRGKTFAYWRCHPYWDAAEGKEWFGFRFDYIIEGDIRYARELVSRKEEGTGSLQALLRQLDSYFPPFMVTLNLNQKLQEETCKNVLKILDTPFRKPLPNCFNLVKENMYFIDELVSESKWKGYCLQARKISEEILRGKPEFYNTRKDALEYAVVSFKHRLAQLKLRSVQGHGGEMIGRDVNLKLETDLCKALLLGMKKPKITLDSVGFIVISGRNPLEQRG